MGGAGPGTRQVHFSFGMQVVVPVGNGGQTFTTLFRGVRRIREEGGLRVSVWRKEINDRVLQVHSETRIE